MTPLDGRGLIRSQPSVSEPAPDLGELERVTTGYMGSDFAGLARVIIGCTQALLVALHRIERRLDR